MTDQPRLLDAYRRVRDAGDVAGRAHGGSSHLPPPGTLPTADDPPDPPAFAEGGGWTMMAGVLALAGWDCQVRMGRRIWSRSRDDPWCPWYSEEMAYRIEERGDEG